jgi:hypothetical protein
MKKRSERAGRIRLSLSCWGSGRKDLRRSRINLHVSCGLRVTSQACTVKARIIFP